MPVFPWQTNIALIGGFAAKEVILSTFSTAYSLDSSESENGEAMLEYRLKHDSHGTMPAVISLLLFILLYAPCFVTVVAMAKESSWRWALFGTFGSLIFTYILCVIVYQACSAFL